MVLYHWRVHNASTALNASGKDYAEEAQLRAITGHLNRMGVPAEPDVRPNGLLHLRWKYADTPLVSIIIPSKEKPELLKRCLDSIAGRTSYAAWEVIVVDNNSSEPATLDYYRSLEQNPRVRIVPFNKRFNYSAANNVGAAEARGELLLFLNNDTEAQDPARLEELVGWARYGPIGVVGARLLAENRLIQHAGVVLGMGGFAGHPFAEYPPLSFALTGSTGWYRDFLAVTGACMLMRKAVFAEINGFDENFILCGSDVEICLRARRKGYRVVYNPFAELLHLESQTRDSSIPAEDFSVSLEHYRPYLEHGDPFWSPNVSLWEREIAFRPKSEQSSLAFAECFVAKIRAAAPTQATTSDEVALKTPHDTAFSEEARLVSWFDYNHDDIRRLRASHASNTERCEPQTVLWLLPAFEYAFYGGVYTIARFGEYWRKEKGAHNIFGVCGEAEASVIAERLRPICPEVQASDVYVLCRVSVPPQIFLQRMFASALCGQPSTMLSSSTMPNGTSTSYRITNRLFTAPDRPVLW